MERDILIGVLTVILRSLIMIFFSGRFLGIFSHYVVYKLRDLSFWSLNLLSIIINVTKFWGVIC